MDETHFSHRHSASRPGRIVFHGHQSGIDCIVREMTDDGARLIVNSLVGLPDAFYLDVAASTRACRVVWRSGATMGVAFEQVR